MINWPTPPNGASDVAAFMRRLVDCCKRSVPKAGVGLLYEEQADGIMLRTNLPPLPQPAVSTPTFMFPFKIYPVTNVSATAAQIAPFTALGLSINDFTFQIRNGLAGCRPYINVPELVQGDPIASPLANSELIAQAGCTDSLPDAGTASNAAVDFYYPQVANTGATVVLNDTTPTLIAGRAAGSLVNVSNQQIALNPNPTQGTEIENPNLRCAAFWLEVIDDATAGIVANLWGCMFSAEAASTRTNTPIPTGPNIITLGYVEVQNPAGGPNQPTGYLVEQIQGGNAVNRFPPGFSCMRGRWAELYAALPAGKTTLNWWPGDIVVKDTAMDGSGFYTVWQYIGATVATLVVGAVPSVGVQWQQVGITDN
jgi:hypothetical protein